MSLSVAPSRGSHYLSVVLVDVNLIDALCRRLNRRQEKLVQSYLEDANARRQFEDAASLQASLDELRGEIERLRMSSS